MLKKRPGETLGSKGVLLLVILETNWLCLHETRSESENIPYFCYFCEK